MKILIINGNPDGSNLEFESYLLNLKQQWQSEGHTVEKIDLSTLNLVYCTGCFGCWVRDPGECVVKDDGSQVRRAMIWSDLTVLAAPLVMGFPSALLKKMVDKMIPLVHPYIVVDHGEAHHRPRYSHYPRLALLVQPEADTDAEDLKIIAEIFNRTALNIKTNLLFCRTTTDPVEEVANETHHI
ncbi:MAG TPA: NAD(P)H-dependent oxidoreductase [Anaerolineaceae bacterium]